MYRQTHRTTSKILATRTWFFLEAFASDRFEDVSLNQWLRRMPSEMLKAHLGIDKQQALTIPEQKLEVI